MGRHRLLLLAAIATVAAVASFTAVRSWFTPLRAAAVNTATLSVETEPAGAELLIDSRARGITPQTIAIDPGSHTVEVRRPGAQRAVQLTLGPGAQMAQYFDLRGTTPTVPATGRLSVVTDPPGARVMVDGRARGVSPLVVEDLTPAAHTVGVSSDAGSSQRAITVESGTTKELVFSLSRSQAPLAGWLRVASPFPVDVVEGNEVVGTSGTARTMLAAGSHDVTLRNDAVGYAAHHRVEVVAGRVATVDVVPPQATLNVNARPWADVLIDGVSVGQTPLADLKLPVGTHRVTFRHPQLGEREESVLISARGPNRLAVDLTR